MSQYPFPPPPYSPPAFDYRAMAMMQPTTAGRSAALWQTVLGALIFLTGTCAAATVWIVPDDIIVKAIQQQQAAIPPIADMSPAQEMRMFMTIAACLMILAGGLLLLLMMFVRRGGKVSTIFSIVFTGLITLILTANFVSELLQIAGNPQVILAVAMMAGVLALAAVTLVKLVQALRTAGTAQIQAMQQAYYWMMQHQQAGGVPAGYGYGYGNYPQQGPVAPAPSAPVQPPSPPSPPPAPPPGDQV